MATTKEEKAAARVEAIRAAWTPERRKAAAEKARARRAAETPEQLAARKAKRAGTMEANPEIERKRAAGIARTRRNRHDKMSAVAKEVYARKSDEARAASLANLERRFDPDVVAKRRETLNVPRRVRKRRKAEQSARDAIEPTQTYRMREWTDEERSANSELLKARWDAMTPDEHEALMQKRMSVYAQPEVKAAMCRTRQKVWDDMPPDKRSARLRRMQDGRRLKDYTLVNGRVERFHSSWEAACANVFIHLAVQYRPQVHLVLGDVNYFADFVIDDRNGGRIIVEVKGHPKAWPRWNDVTVPALHRNLCGAWRVFLLPHKPRGLMPETLSRFLDDMMLVATGRPLLEGEVETAPATPQVVAAMSMCIV